VNVKYYARDLAAGTRVELAFDGAFAIGEQRVQVASMPFVVVDRSELR
jgi:hypothetical protein